MSGPELPEPSLGEWACLGALHAGPAHGWAVARRLRRDGDLGRVWQLSRPLTYRSLDLLARRGWVRTVSEERGDSGPNRTILAPSRTGRARFRIWLRTPVEHLRDVRGELLLKLVLAEQLGVDPTALVVEQQRLVAEQAAVLRRELDQRRDELDVVIAWRLESTLATERFLDRVREARLTTGSDA
ncbi:MAG: hypothetical protein R2705_08385 [Ilumatobacteraceae bacterium]